MSNPPAIELRRFDSIASIRRDDWNACIRGNIEDYDYLLAVERSKIKGFSYGYYALIRNDKLLAALPAFFTQYDLATTADGVVRRVLLAIKRLFPSLLSLNLACLGSFATESCPISMHASLNDAEQKAYFGQLLDFFEQDTKQRGIHLLAFKDLSAANKPVFGHLLEESGFHLVTGMPTAISHINFTSIDDYLLSLSSATRKDMRRKLKSKSAIRMEIRTDITDILSDIYEMYLQTKSRSDLQFEELTPEYFQEVLKSMNERALCTLYYAENKLVGANLMLINGERLLDKFFCMRTEDGHKHNLYFLSWFANLQLCLDKNIRIYQSGQAGYETKLRLGCELVENWMYFRHRRRFVHALLKLASPLLAFKIPERKTA